MISFEKSSIEIFKKKKNLNLDDITPIYPWTDHALIFLNDEKEILYKKKIESLEKIIKNLKKI